MGREKITITKRKAKGVLADMIANMDEDSLARTRENMEKTIICEDYCSYEVAKLLKEKGANVELGGMYVDKDNNFVHASIAPLKVKDYEKVWDSQFIPTCTHQMAMKQLREKRCSIEISSGIDFMHNLDFWSALIICLDNITDRAILVGRYDTYEEAVEAALKYALENLIN